MTFDYCSKVVELQFALKDILRLTATHDHRRAALHAMAAQTDLAHIVMAAISGLAQEAL